MITHPHSQCPNSAAYSAVNSGLGGLRGGELPSKFRQALGMSHSPPFLSLRLAGGEMEIHLPAPPPLSSLQPLLLFFPTERERWWVRLAAFSGGVLFRACPASGANGYPGNRAFQLQYLLNCKPISKFPPIWQGPERVDSVVGINGHQKLLSCLTRFVRNLVSKKRRRMLIAGYDLDMSYITDKILAMSFPAESMRAMYRNPLWQVKSVLEMRHSNHYKVYNLCAEESYNPSHFCGRVEMYPFDDNHVPSLSMIKLFCESVHSWLSADPQNIAVIHCMAGKGRTGLMVCSYLVYCGMTAEEALQLYAERRTTNNEGVSIASQRRYVDYWHRILTFPKGELNRIPEVNLPAPRTRDLRRIRLYDTINIDSVFFVISELQEVPGEMYQPPVELARSCCLQIKKGHYRTNSPWYHIPFIDNYVDEKPEAEASAIADAENHHIPIKKTYLDCYFDTPLLVSGDLRVSFYEKMIGGRLFYACFNTNFIGNSLLQLSLTDLDKVGYKGKLIAGPAFRVELLFGPADN